MFSKEANVQLSLEIIDTIASEYGWSLEAISDIPMDVVLKIFKKIQQRKQETLKLQTKLFAIACGCGFNGKLEVIDKIFGDKVEVNEQQVEAELFNLYKSLGKDVKAFDKEKQDGIIRL